MADEMKTKPATLRLTAPVVDAVERYRADREKELRRMLPGYELSQAGALAALVTGYLQSLGYIPKEGQPAAEKPVEVERRKHPREAPTAAKPKILLTQKDKKRAGIEADLEAGELMQKDIAAKWNSTDSQVSRIKSQMKKKGRMQ